QPGLHSRDQEGVVTSAMPGGAAGCGKQSIGFRTGQVGDHGSRVATATARAVNNVKKLAEPVWDPHEHTMSWRAVWAYSRKRAVRDGKTLTLQENRAKAVIAGEKAARTPRFVTTKNGTQTLDEASL